MGNFYSFGFLIVVHITDTYMERMHKNDIGKDKN
jgi:hypothetical protein